MSFDLKLSQGGLVIQTSGDLQIVQDVEKLIQDLHKIITTPLGANQFFPWYGCGATAIIGSPLDFSFSSTIATSQVHAALETLKKIQIEQDKIQVLSPQEQLAAIRNVLVNENALDPRFLNILVSVANKALQSFNTTIPIS